MKSMKKEYDYYITDSIYCLCNRNQYFTHGTNEQYDKMFSMATSEESTARDVAIMIWTCSSPETDLAEVQTEIKKIYQEVEDLYYERFNKEQEELAQYCIEIDLC